MTFSLEEKTDALLGTLSKGMKQKVALIAATLHDPRVLVLDEPLTALDPKTQVFVNSWIAGPGQGRHDGAPLDAQPGDSPGPRHEDRHNRQGQHNRPRGRSDSLRRMADAGKDARLDEVFLKLTAETA